MTASALPWLEAVENEDGPRAISARKMLMALLLVLLAAAIVAGTMFWLGRQDPAPWRAHRKLIKAEPGPYKVKPTDPGGLDVAGDSETAYSTSAGEDPDAALDVRKLPKEMTPLPVETPQPAAPRRRRFRQTKPRNPPATMQRRCASRTVRARRSSLAPMPRR